MMFKTCITGLFIALLFPGFYLRGQPVDRNEIIREMGEPVLFGEIYTQHPQVHGTPFFNDEWSRGSIYLANGAVAADKMLKYNGLTDQLFWFDSSRNVTIILDGALIQGFSIEDPLIGEVLDFRKMKEGLSGGGWEHGTFMQLLYEGDFSLYVHRRVEERGRRVVYRNGRRVELPNLEAQPAYYVCVPHRGLVRVRQMRKSFLYDLVPGYEDAIRRVLSDHPSRLRDENALTSAIKAIDEL